MKRFQLFLLAVILVLPTLPETAFASGSLRCGRHIISASTSSTQYEVLKKCGEPAQRLGRTWVYEQPGGAPRQITFDDFGRVMFIERLGR